MHIKDAPSFPAFQKAKEAFVAAVKEHGKGSRQAAKKQRDMQGKLKKAADEAGLGAHF